MNITMWVCEHHYGCALGFQEGCVHICDCALTASRGCVHSYRWMCVLCYGCELGEYVCIADGCVHQYGYALEVRILTTHSNFPRKG